MAVVYKNINDVAHGLLLSGIGEISGGIFRNWVC